LLADELTEAEFAIANGTFVRQVTALYRSTIIGDPNRWSLHRLRHGGSSWTRNSRRWWNSPRYIWPKRANVSHANWQRSTRTPLAHEVGEGPGVRACHEQQ